MLTRPSRIEAVRVNPVTGQLEINPDRERVQAWVQGTTRAARVSLSASAKTEDSIVVSAEKGLSGDCEWEGLTSDHLGAYRMELFVGGATNKKFMNVPIHVDFIAGTAQLPFYFSAPLFVEAQNSLNITFTAISTSITNQCRVKAHGRRYLDYRNDAERRRVRGRAWGRREWPFWHGLDDTTVTLVASATRTQKAITITSEGDFECEYLMLKSDGPGRVQVLESVSGRPLHIGGGAGGTGCVEFVHISGNALYPYRLPMPAWLKRNTKLDVFFDDLSGRSNLVEMALVGRVLDYPEGNEAAAPPPQAAPVARSVIPAGLIPAWMR